MAYFVLFLPAACLQRHPDYPYHRLRGLENATAAVSGDDHNRPLPTFDISAGLRLVTSFSLTKKSNHEGSRGIDYTHAHTCEAFARSCFMKPTPILKPRIPFHSWQNSRNDTYTGVRLRPLKPFHSLLSQTAKSIWYTRFGRAFS